jgi:membrane protease YdiL (CAAX protease family)
MPSDAELQPPARGLSWLVGPFVLAAFVIGQLVVELLFYAGLGAAGVTVHGPKDFPAPLFAVRLVVGILVGGGLALWAVRATTAREEPQSLLAPAAFGPLRPSWVLLALLIAPCVAILAADADAMLQHLLPRSAAEAALYRDYFFPGDASSRALTMLATIVLAPMTEELLFRGALRRGLARRYGLAAGAILTSLLFAVAHLNVRAAPIFFAFGLANSLLAEQTGGLALPMVMHALYNATFYCLPERAALPGRPDPRHGPLLPWLVMLGAAAGLTVGVLMLRRLLQSRSNSPAMP